MQKALITGASSGIGKELAHIMAKAGHNLVLVSRDKTKLNKVKSEIQAHSPVSISVYTEDLSRVGSAQQLYEKTRHEGIEILINNAGVGLKGDFFNDDIARTNAMMHLNMTSPVELAQLFGSDMIKKNRGKILNIGSIAAFLPGPKQPVYYATKSFIRSFSRSLSHNLRHTNITVTVLHPGITKTEFFKSSDAPLVIGGASAQSVANHSYKAMMQGRIEVTHGLWNKLLMNVVIRAVPYRWHAPIVDKLSEA